MKKKKKDNFEKESIEIPKKFKSATQKYEPDLEELEKKVKEMKNKKESEVKEKEIIKQEELVKKVEKKEGSFRPMIIIMLASILIASLWDRIPTIKNVVHFIFDPSAGSLLNWNLNWGMLIIVLIITIFTTLVQKYATDQKTLKELKKEQKEIQKEMNKFKSHTEKMMELQKKQFKLMPKQMKLSRRALAFTGIPFILFFRWFNDYFTTA